MIYFEDNQDKVKIKDEFYKLIEDIVDYALREEGVKIDYEISITLVDNDEIKEINSEHRNISKVTDVLSFPLLNYTKGKVFKECYKDNIFGPGDLEGDKLLLGDIVLSLEKAEEQGIEYNHGFLREACYLTIHSVLHILGYDHMEEDEKKVMRAREEEILKKFDLSRGGQHEN
ncbi:MAG: rRNA maturation RNase YbeY [Solirubrobacterales bacterium]